VSLQPGDPAPAVELLDTSGEPHSLPLPGEAPAAVIAWTCNHCPYALAWHERIQAVARNYAEKGVPFLQVNSNDADRYPADSLDAMRARVEAGDFATPYLHDSTQEVARAYGAQKTPDIFVLDSALRLAYRGAPDADYQDESQDARWLRDALDAVLAGRAPEPAATEPVGCSIKWREG
jgi:peroxiredoxin